MKIESKQRLCSFYKFLEGIVALITFIGAMVFGIVVGFLIGDISGFPGGFITAMIVMYVGVLTLNFISRRLREVEDQLNNEYLPKLLELLPEIRINVEKYEIMRSNDELHVINAYHYTGGNLKAIKLSTKIIKSDTDTLKLVYKDLKYNVGKWKPGFYDVHLHVPNNE